jgi:hypothetical protein
MGHTIRQLVLLLDCEEQLAGCTNACVFEYGIGKGISAVVLAVVAKCSGCRIRLVAYRDYFRHADVLPLKILGIGCSPWINSSFQAECNEWSFEFLLFWSFFPSLSGYDPHTNFLIPSPFAVARVAKMQGQRGRARRAAQRSSLEDSSCRETPSGNSHDIALNRHRPAHGLLPVSLSSTLATCGGGKLKILALCRFSFWSRRVQPVGSPLSRPCTSAGGVVASAAVNASRIL